MSFLLKAPEATLDYAIDWGAEYLSGDAIAASEWSVSPDEPGGAAICLTRATLDHRYHSTLHTKDQTMRQNAADRCRSPAHTPSCSTGRSAAERDYGKTQEMWSIAEAASLGAGPIEVQVRQVGTLALSRPETITINPEDFA